MSDITVAISAPTVGQMFQGVVDKLSFEHAGTSGPGIVSVDYDVKFHFRNDTLVQPTLDLHDDGTVFLHNLKILWDKLELTINISIPQICVGGFCIIPDFTGGCLVRAPQICIFGGHPDLSIPMAIDGIVTSELSVEGSFQVIHFMNPNRLVTDDDWDAHDNQRANAWRLALAAQIVHVDPFHLADIFGDLFKNLVIAGIDNVMNSLGLPQWAIDAINWVLGGIDNIIRVIFNLPDDLVQWLEGLLNGPFGLVDAIATFVTNWLLNSAPITITEDPVPIPDVVPIDPTIHPTSLIPLMLPIASLQATVNSHEMVVEGTLA